VSDAIKVLFVEDVRTDAELEVRELRRSGLKVEHRLVETEAEFMSAISDFLPDIILSDFSMPQFDGMAALALARTNCPLVPFVFVSGTLGEEYAIRALQQGASDYVLKTNLIRLPAAVTRAIREARERAARRVAEEELAAARQRLESIVESLDDVVWSWSIDERRLTYMGPAAIALFGRRAEELMRDSNLWHESVHSLDRAAVLNSWRGLLSGRKTIDLEYRIVREDGAVRWINDRARVIPGPSGEPERIDGIVRDITGRMEERNRIARLTRIRELSSAVNSAIVRLRQPGQLFEEICRIAIDEGGFQAARVVIVDAESKSARLAAASGGDIDTFIRALDAYNLATTRNNSILAQSLRTKAPAFQIHAASDSAAGDAGLADASTRASASLPFLVKDEAVGALVLSAPDPNFFDHDETLLLQELASNVSFALELSSQQERIDYLAYYDVLTGLPNRTLFNDRLAQAITAAKREQSILALLIFNMTRLRAINESLGERAGDEVLRQVAARLSGLTGDVARVARLGGDLFAMMIPGMRDLAQVGQVLADGQFRFFDRPFLFEEKELAISARAGVALFPNDGEDADSLLHNAESALNQARKAGDPIQFYAAEVNARVAERFQLESRLQRAMDRREFELHFQPKINLDSRRTVGLEALLRWRDPERGLIPPVDFVFLLEETGLLLEVGRWVIQEAIAQRRRWLDEGLAAPRIAVNISALQLKQRNFVAEVQEDLRECRGDVGLDMEITESMLMENVSEGVEKLRAIRDMGIHISIDDFGTGYSSLAYISRLPVNALKIDRSFIHGMTDDPDKTSIVSTIISLGHALRLEVIAEGVETEQQSQLLRLLRCDQIQGYLISRPLSPQDSAARMASERQGS
jgi:diguanylate cyclase (GGDEF)-like protein/PAS domain S-box-containing protein